MASKATVLEWKSYPATASMAFQNLYNDMHFTDVTIACEDNQKITAHKVILSECSLFFNKILKGNNSPHPLIYLQGVSIDDLILLKTFMYLGRASVLKEQIESLMKISKSFLNSNKEKTLQDVHSENVECTFDNVKEVAQSIQSGNPFDFQSKSILSRQIAKNVEESFQVDKDDSHKHNLNSNQYQFQSDVMETKCVPQKRIKRSKLSCNKCDYATFFILN